MTMTMITMIAISLSMRRRWVSLTAAPPTPAPNIEHQESSPPQAQSPTTQPRIFNALPHQRRRIGHPLSWNAGFSDNAMFQRSASDGVAVYGFADSSASVSVKVEGTTATGTAVSYDVAAEVVPWADTSGCNSTHCIDNKTPLPPLHGNFTFRAVLKPEAAGGDFTVTASSTSGGPNSSIQLDGVTYWPQGRYYFR